MSTVKVGSYTVFVPEWNDISYRTVFCAQGLALTINIPSHFIFTKKLWNYSKFFKYKNENDSSDTLSILDKIRQSSFPAKIGMNILYGLPFLLNVYVFYKEYNLNNKQYELYMLCNIMLHYVV